LFILCVEAPLMTSNDDASSNEREQPNDSRLSKLSFPSLENRKRLSQWAMDCHER
jgi:hypothetical protein